MISQGLFQEVKTFFEIYRRVNLTLRKVQEKKKKKKTSTKVSNIKKNKVKVSHTEGKMCRNVIKI